MNIFNETALFVLNQIRVFPPRRQPTFREVDLLLPTEEIVSSNTNYLAVRKPPPPDTQKSENNIESVEMTERSFVVPSHQMRMSLSRNSTPSSNRRRDDSTDRISNYMIRRKKLRSDMKKKKRDEIHNGLMEKLNPQQRPTKLEESKKKEKKKKESGQPQIRRSAPHPTDFRFVTPRKQMVSNYSKTPERYRAMYESEMSKARNPEDTPSRIIDAWLKVKKNRTPVKISAREESSIPFPHGMKVYYGKQSVRIKSRRFRSIDRRRIERKLGRKK